MMIRKMRRIKRETAFQKSHGTFPIKKHNFFKNNVAERLKITSELLINIETNIMQKLEKQTKIVDFFV